MTNRQAKKRRLERAGYVYVAGWVRADAKICAAPHGVTVQRWLDYHAESVARIADEPPKPRGRPRKP